jgi:hypothetical protein
MITGLIVRRLINFAPGLKIFTRLSQNLIKYLPKAKYFNHCTIFRFTLLKF